MIKIRQELPEDMEAIWKVNEAAFGRPAEAGLVEALRRRGVVTLSLVAEWEGDVVGHILFSPVTITNESGGVVTAVALGPMAVSPNCQRQGIGSQLVQTGLDMLRQAGHEMVIVLGHPDFYPRFGFAPASQSGIRWEVEVPDEVFMVMALQPGALEGVTGIVRYQPEFSAV
ncbi:MAG TPA: N-acetyltransferase [Chloroflexota bacterium]|nr:N-acetyltransferase [Chloroflexota bacterium]